MTHHLPYLQHARMAELADALDLGSSGRPWGFKSLYAHPNRKSFLSSFNEEKRKLFLRTCSSNFWLTLIIIIINI